MGSENHLVVVGAGNVGLQAILTLALVHRNRKDPWSIAVVDFDRVEGKDVNKGYHPRLIGRLRCSS